MLKPDVQGLVEALLARRTSLAVAEGDTGGLLLEWLTSVAGSSAVVVGGVVAYHDDLKRSLLAVPAELLRQHGAVSSAVASAMADGVREATGAGIGVATTGIAGPGGARPGKPVGLAFVAAASADRALVREHRWHGDRQANRQASASAAIGLLWELLGVHGNK